MPVCKVTANEHTYQWLEDNMDVDLSGIIRGEATVEELARMEHGVRARSGRKRDIVPFFAVQVGKVERFRINAIREKERVPCLQLRNHRRKIGGRGGFINRSRSMEPTVTDILHRRHKGHIVLLRTGHFFG